MNEKNDATETSGDQRQKPIYESGMPRGTNSVKTHFADPANDKTVEYGKALDAIRESLDAMKRHPAHFDLYAHFIDKHLKAVGK